MLLPTDDISVVDVLTIRCYKKITLSRSVLIYISGLLFNRLLPNSFNLTSLLSVHISSL